MRFVIYGVAVLVAVVVLFGAYVRLAPSDPMRWNMPITASQDQDLKGGAIRVVPRDEVSFGRVMAVMRTLPRTRILAGSMAERRITYVTRSKLWGFPDYTTVQLGGGVVKLYGRLRFGRSDLGVNRERLERILRMERDVRRPQGG